MSSPKDPIKRAEWIQKLSISQTNRCKNPIYIAQMSERQKNKKMSTETKNKISIANTGKIFTKEHCKKLSLSKKGKNNPMYGKHPTDDTRKKMSTSHKGIPFTKMLVKSQLQNVKASNYQKIIAQK